MAVSVYVFNLVVPSYTASAYNEPEIPAPPVTTNAPVVVSVAAEAEETENGGGVER